MPRPSATSGRLGVALARAVRGAHASGVRPPGWDYVEVLERVIEEGALPYDAREAERPFDEQLAEATGWFRRAPGPREDPRSDAELLALHDQGVRMAATVQWRRLMHLDVHPLPARVGPMRDELRPDDLFHAVAKAFASTGITPWLSPEHTWSSPAKRYVGLGYLARAAVRRRIPVPALGASKLLLLLVWGATSRHTPTGDEARLRKHILARPSGAVTIPELTLRAAELANGDLYRAFLTIFNVLSDGHWRLDRDRLPVHDRLRPVMAAGGDNFRAWYHFFGAALYGLVRPRWLSYLAAFGEAIAGFVFRGPDWHTAVVNLAGAELGARLRGLARRAATAHEESRT